MTTTDDGRRGDYVIQFFIQRTRDEQKKAALEVAECKEALALLQRARELTPQRPEFTEVDVMFGEIEETLEAQVAFGEMDPATL
jgi:hypothetical protein